jgi:hypothetical protein
MNPVIKFLMRLFTKPKEIKPGLESSINASYTVTELGKTIENTSITSFNIKKDFIGLSVTGQKL